ncbi:MAG: FAD-dependent oxidoreductase [Gemmatimonadota bacterium]
MSAPLGTPARPLRVAVVGSGPSGFYAVEHLQKQAGLAVEIDMFDRLPTPFGLVRGGVAPDHQKIKAVTRVYDRLASHPTFRFLGNVTVGKDVSHDELLQRYDAVIYAVGAQTDRTLGIPGEHLPGSHAATEFVGWYNGHPDYRDFSFDLTHEAVAVIGIGNVAIDVARVLAKAGDELRTTDVCGHALDALRESRVRTIYILGRRGPVQAAFTNPELKELGELASADIVVRQEDLALDEHSRAALGSGENREAEKNVRTLEAFAARGPSGKPRRIVLRFLVSPVEILGTDRVEAIRVMKNRLEPDGRGGVKAVPTGETETIPVGLVFRSVGYKGVPVPGLPFDERTGTIPNVEGRALVAPDAAETLRGTYAVGWIKRGPVGVIGTNKPCAVETVEHLLEDAKAGRIGASGSASTIDELLASRGAQVVTYADWKRLDRLEQERGRLRGAPREKFTRISEMLDAVRAGVS